MSAALLPNHSPTIPLDLLETLGQRLARREGAFWGQLNWQQRQAFIWDAERRVHSALDLLNESAGCPHEAPNTLRDLQLVIIRLHRTAGYHGYMERECRTRADRFSSDLGVF